MKTVLITGASGVIGKKICERLCKKYIVFALDKARDQNVEKTCQKFFEIDLADEKSLELLFKTCRPDIVIHCAGLGEQGINVSDYRRVNHIATQKLSIQAGKANPDAFFIFMSSVAVYGEKNEGQSVREDDPCWPTSVYGQSKRDAEKSLLKAFNKKQIGKLEILRLTPVYDSNRIDNLGKRVFGPKKMCYFRYGKGRQKVSVLCLNNLVDWVEFTLKQKRSSPFYNIYNMSDKRSYSFNQIIEMFKNAVCKKRKRTITIPIIVIDLVTKISGWIFKSKASWLNSCYEKLAFDQVFDNKKVLDTGFEPRESLQSVFKK